jgi:hypothetical protein
VTEEMCLDSSVYSIPLAGAVRLPPLDVASLSEDELRNLAAMREALATLKPGQAGYRDSITGLTEVWREMERRGLERDEHGEGLRA